MILLIISLLSLGADAQTPEASPPEAKPVGAAVDGGAPATKESSDYEVDYEEEPEVEEVEEPVVVEKPVKKKEKKSAGKKTPKESVSQGSRAEKKIIPIMKSETKSVYKKHGKPLDVDSD